MKRIAALALTLGMLAGCSKSATPPSPPPQVYTMEAKAQSVPLRREFSGRVSAYQSANVVARVSGVLLKRLYREGDDVHKGQLLFQIDPAYYQALLDNDLALLAQDQATLVDAKLTAERARKLLRANAVVSQQTVDDANAAEGRAAGKVLQDQAAIESARLNLGYTNVVAPIDGVAGQQEATVGALVGNGASDTGAGGTLLTMIEQIDPVYVNFTIDAADLTTLRQAQAAGQVKLASQSQTKVAVTLPNGAAYGRDGALDYSGVLVSAATGALNLRAVLANPDRILLPGMFVRLTVDFGSQNNAFLIPQQALLRDPAGAYALVVAADGKVARKNVTASDTYGNSWIVTHGLADGDQVIVSGLQRAREGQPVVASPWRAPTRDGKNASTAFQAQR